MPPIPSPHPDLAALLSAVESGDLVRVRSAVEHLRGTGVCPPRLTLLDCRDEEGQRAEDRAYELGKTDPRYNAIGDYLQRQRLQMEYFE